VSSASSGSIRLRIFFAARTASAFGPDALQRDIPGLQFAAPPSHRLNIEPGAPCHHGVAPAAEPQCFEARVQPPLLLVEGGQKRDQVPFHVTGRELAVRRGPPGLHLRLASFQLRGTPFHGDVQVFSTDLVSHYTLAAVQGLQSPLDAHPHHLLQLTGESSLGRLVDQPRQGFQQGAVTRKPDALAYPQAVPIPPGQRCQGVVFASMRVAAMIAQGAQLAQRRHLHRCTQELLDLLKGADPVFGKGAHQFVRGVLDGSHNVTIGFGDHPVSPNSNITVTCCLFLSPPMQTGTTIQLYMFLCVLITAR